jgi:hypothetical protein
MLARRRPISSATWNKVTVMHVVPMFVARRGLASLLKEIGPAFLQPCLRPVLTKSFRPHLAQSTAAMFCLQQFRTEGSGEMSSWDTIV